ncbi:unnamed protein product [Amoebophrya sp. A120]|nr:unnamed protein product [Amoebophrya sp. A120]|eukprot:GSA120T00008112001.1
MPDADQHHERVDTGHQEPTPRRSCVVEEQMIGVSAPPTSASSAQLPDYNSRKLHQAALGERGDLVLVPGKQQQNTEPSTTNDCSTANIKPVTSTTIAASWLGHGFFGRLTYAPKNQVLRDSDSEPPAKSRSSERPTMDEQGSLLRGTTNTSCGAGLVLRPVCPPSNQSLLTRSHLAVLPKDVETSAGLGISRPLLPRPPVHHDVVEEVTDLSSSRGTRRGRTPVAIEEQEVVPGHDACALSKRSSSSSSSSSASFSSDGGTHEDIEEKAQSTSRALLPDHDRYVPRRPQVNSLQMSGEAENNAASSTVVLPFISPSTATAFKKYDLQTGGAREIVPDDLKQHDRLHAQGAEVQLLEVEQQSYLVSQNEEAEHNCLAERVTDKTLRSSSALSVAPRAGVLEDLVHVEMKTTRKMMESHATSSTPRPAALKITRDFGTQTEHTQGLLSGSSSALAHWFFTWHERKRLFWLLLHQKYWLILWKDKCHSENTKTGTPLIDLLLMGVAYLFKYYPRQMIACCLPRARCRRRRRKCRAARQAFADNWRPALIRFLAELDLPVHDFPEDFFDFSGWRTCFARHQRAILLESFVYFVSIFGGGSCAAMFFYMYGPRGALGVGFAVTVGLLVGFVLAYFLVVFLYRFWVLCILHCLGRDIVPPQLSTPAFLLHFFGCS